MEAMWDLTVKPLLEKKQAVALAPNGERLPKELRLD